MAWRQIWVVDFEFCKNRYGRPDPIHLSARELYSRQTIPLWRDRMGPVPPYDIGPGSLFVCYSGSEAELACHLALGWPLPCNVVDLITEYRLAICGQGNEKDLGLLAALARCGITPKISAEEKKRAQQRCMQGWPFSAEDKRWIQSYGDIDVIEETELLCKLGQPAVSDHAVWRGEFTKAVARMWWRGVPVDPLFRELVEDREAWHELLEWIIARNQSEFPVFAGQTTKQKELFEKWLTGLGIPVPRTAAGRVSIALNVLARLAAEHEELRSFEEGRRILGQLHDLILPIFADNRLRAWFVPFWTITSRAAPPTNGYIYNLPAWMRAMMSPAEGSALAYLDYEAMEFGLAGWRSGCPNMREFYTAGDPYIATGIAFGGMPAGATKATHRDLRNVYKTGGLASLYGIGVRSLAGRIKRPVPFAREFLRHHHDVFSGYWSWSDAVVAEAIRSGSYTSRHGWHYRVKPPYNIRSLRNWPIQSAGADILRTAVIYADVLGIEMLATAHDAVLIQAREEEIEHKARLMAYCMEKAALLHTDGFRLRVETEIKHHGERFMDPRGKETFAAVEQFLNERGRNVA